MIDLHMKNQYNTGSYDSVNDFREADTRYFVRSEKIQMVLGDITCSLYVFLVRTFFCRYQATRMN